ncbi:hypothetical protein TNCV_2173491 [Trichonephila clavipes]|nr:hypothetical protein TNCV_2173491 [Trichonephila clavipes]
MSRQNNFDNEIARELDYDFIALQHQVTELIPQLTPERRHFPSSCCHSQHSQVMSFDPNDLTVLNSIDSVKGCCHSQHSQVMSFDPNDLTVLNSIDSVKGCCHSQHSQVMSFDPNDLTVLNSIDSVKGYASLSPPSLQLRLCSRFTLLLLRPILILGILQSSPHRQCQRSCVPFTPCSTKKKEKNKAKKNIDSQSRRMTYL